MSASLTDDLRALTTPLRDWRVRRAQRKLARLKARYAAMRELWTLCGDVIPGSVVFGMENLPGEIAEVEELLKQLERI